MAKHPCIYCKKDCDILPLQLGDVFTLTYLRLCNAECLFFLTCEYLYETGMSYDFNAYLWKKQIPEDRKERDDFIERTSNESIKTFARALKLANEEMLKSEKSNTDHQPEDRVVER